MTRRMCPVCVRCVSEARECERVHVKITTYVDYPEKRLRNLETERLSERLKDVRITVVFYVPRVGIIVVF